MVLAAATNLTRSRHWWPLTFLYLAFAASRVAAWAAGVRFDASSLPWFWQYVDPALLQHRLLQSVWYLHSQPPLFNLLLGVGLKAFGLSSFASAAQAAQIAVGVLLMVSLYAVLNLAGLGPWPAAAVCALFVTSPAVLLFENWLFYEYLVAALLVAAVAAFGWFQRRPSAPRSLAVFGILATVCYIRASFQIVALLLVLAFMLAFFRAHRRAVLLGALAPVALVLALSLKNWIVVGTPSTSSWVGMNLAQIDEAGFRPGQKQALQDRGVLGPIWAVDAFAPLSAYAPYIHPKPRPTGIPVLDQQTKPHGTPNYDNREYVDVSRQYLDGFLAVLVHAPGVYLRGVWVGITRAAAPSSDYGFFLGNRSRLEPWVRLFDGAVLWQPHVRWRNGVPTGTAWGLVLAYLGALVFGLVELVRVLRRRSGSATVAFAWLLLAYTTFVMTFGEVSENQRVRFPGDPLATVLVGVMGVRGLARAREVWAASGAPAPARPGSKRGWATAKVAALRRARVRRDTVAGYSVAAWLAVGLFLAGSLLLAITLPYHDWDAFSYGRWSRSIAQHGHVDPYGAGALPSARPLFYALQGGLWAATGISMTAGRLLGLGFALLLLAAVWRAASRRSQLEAALAVIAVVAVPTFAGEAIAGKADVPAAAMVAGVAALAASPHGRARRWAATAVAAFLAVLTKQTVIVPLAVLAAALLLPGLRGRAPARAAAVAAGLALGLLYDLVMALRFHIGLVAYLRYGTAEGYYAALADRTRWDAVLRADVLGAGLRLPLLFALLYGSLRIVGARHRASAAAGIAAALVWSVGGPYAAGVAGGPFPNAETTFTLVGFALVLSCSLLVPEEEAPGRRELAWAWALGVPPLLLWVASTTYADRLASAAWPGLVLLIATASAPAVRALAALGRPRGAASRLTALAAVPVLAVAVWMSLGNLDGLHGYDWVSYRALGWSGLWNSDRTMNIVLPGVQAALAAARPALGPDGTMITFDPSFQYFLPGTRVDDRLAVRCGDLAGHRVFIMLTGDESAMLANAAHGPVTPADWLRCRSPRLEELFDSNGYAVFRIGAGTGAA